MFFATDANDGGLCVSQIFVNISRHVEWIIASISSKTIGCGLNHNYTAVCIFRFKRVIRRHFVVPKWSCDEEFIRKALLASVNKWPWLNWANMGYKIPSSLSTKANRTGYEEKTRIFNGQKYSNSLGTKPPPHPPWVRPCGVARPLGVESV